MGRLENILLYEYSPEAMEAVRSGDAVVSTGGIRRKGDTGKGFLELAKPASMSVADFLSLFEGKDHAIETDERLNMLETRLELSVDGLKKIEKIGWLNNAIIQRTYTLTYEGFIQTIQGLKCVLQQLEGLEHYIRQRDIEDMLQKAQTYLNYLKSDAGKLRSKCYSVTNGIIDNHMDDISAFLIRLLHDVENNMDDQFTSIQILTILLPPFSYMVRKYSSLYYYENNKELMPGNYDGWVNMIMGVSNSKIFKERLEYYINLKYTIPYRDKNLLLKGMNSEIKKLITNIKFDKNYIENHGKDEYLSIDEQICHKTVIGEYYIEGSQVVFFIN